MKRFHVHVAVSDLAAGVRFYSTLFGAEPTVAKPDYAKWMLDDPRVNFAISTRGHKPGVNHLGLQAETEEELADLGERLRALQEPVLEEQEATCCYAKSHKYWALDPAGLAWESFHTLGSAPLYSEDTATVSTPKTSAEAGCCVPDVETAETTASAACCGSRRQEPVAVIAGCC